MSARYPGHQRPPPPYPSGGTRMSGRGAGGQVLSGRGRGTYGSASQSATPNPTTTTSSPSTTTPQTTSSSTPTSASSSIGSASAPPIVQTAASAQQTSECKILSNPNPVCLCKIGQGTVQDIVAMTHELFNHLKLINPANTISLQTPATIQGVLPISNAQEKAAKTEDHLKEINLLFKKLKVIYKNLEPIPSDDATLMLDIDKTQDLIPMKRKLENKEDPDDDVLRKRKFESQPYMQAARELAEVKEKLRSKNQELKSIIDDSRTTIWEINSMLGMRNLGMNQ